MRCWCGRREFQSTAVGECPVQPQDHALQHHRSCKRTCVDAKGFDFAWLHLQRSASTVQTSSQTRGGVRCVNTNCHLSLHISELAQAPRPPIGKLNSSGDFRHERNILFAPCVLRLHRRSICCCWHDVQHAFVAGSIQYLRSFIDFRLACRRRVPQTAPRFAQTSCASHVRNIVRVRVT